MKVKNDSLFLREIGGFAVLFKLWSRGCTGGGVQFWEELTSGGLELPAAVEEEMGEEVVLRTDLLTGTGGGTANSGKGGRHSNSNNVDHNNISNNNKRSKKTINNYRAKHWLRTLATVATNVQTHCFSCANSNCHTFDNSHFGLRFEEHTHAHVRTHKFFYKLDEH